MKRKMTSPTSGSSSSSSKSKEKMCFSYDVCESSSELKRHSEFSSDNVDPKVLITRKVAEEFLDTSYKNLLNYFNHKENVSQGN